LQHSALRPGEASGLPLHEKTLPQHLKNLGYQTHMVGKVAKLLLEIFSGLLPLHVHLNRFQRIIMIVDTGT
ncbi:hypothetical protein AVEN_20153-1, partial [Araneus ventricosus]